MRVLPLPAMLAIAAPLFAQTVCPPTPAYAPCDIVFELNEEEARAHPNPYMSVDLQAEMRSPRYRTIGLAAFWDGGRRLVLRLAPTEAGRWDFRVVSNIARFNGMQGNLEATASDSPGFLRPRNVHHWSYTEADRPHLWMGDTCYRFAFLEQDLFDRLVEARARQKFNHLRGSVIGFGDDAQKAFPSPDEPNPEHFRRLDQRILALNRKGITADLLLAGDENHLARVFPTWQQRKRYVRYLISRYAAMNITWQGVQEFEEYENGRQLLKEIGELLKKYDPYNHPRSTHTVATSAPLAADGWMNYRVYQSSDNPLGTIEHLLYGMPAVNSEFAYEDSGAGRTHAHHVDTDTFRKRLWNASMNGQYPVYGNTGTYTGKSGGVDVQYLDAPGARQMTVWFDFFSGTRFWDLEPYFDVDGGRALALPGIEYIVYVEKPGPVEVLIEKHGYDIRWFHPATGQYIKQKEFKGTRFRGQPPDNSHDWVLHISREGKKEGMGRSYKFESRPILLQEVEQNPKNVPFDILEPAEDTLKLPRPERYEVKVTRDTRATRAMMWLWTGEVVADGQGYRVLATDAKGEMRIPRGIVKNTPAVLNLRLAGMNANGKIYFYDKVYKVTE